MQEQDTAVEYSFDDEWGLVRKLLNATHQGDGHVSNSACVALRDRWERRKGWMAEALGPNLIKEYPSERAVSPMLFQSQFNYLLSDARAAGVFSFARWDKLCQEVVPDKMLDPQSLVKGTTAIGQKIGRYLRLQVLEDTQRDPCLSTDFCTRWMDDHWGQITQRLSTRGVLRVSARPLDILLMSEHGVRSCMGLTRDFPAGSTAYLMDAVTMIALHYNGEPKSCNLYGVELLYPKKDWRQMVYFDKPEEPNAVALSYEYPDGNLLLAKEARFVAGRLLCKFNAIDPPRWAKLARGYGFYHNEFGHMYTDSPQCVLAVRGRSPSQFNVGNYIPCIQCGEDASEGLLCDSCQEDHTSCCYCGGRIPDDEALNTPDGECCCERCYNERFTQCYRCGATVDVDDVQEVHRRSALWGGGYTTVTNTWCDVCVENYATECSRCGLPWDNEHMHAADAVRLFRQVYLNRADGYVWTYEEGPICAECLVNLAVEECSECGQDFAIDGGSAYDGPPDVCPECHDEQLQSEAKKDDPTKVAS